MLDVRDAMLDILDRETLAELAARQGRASIDPRGLHAEALAGLEP
jgi:transposase